MSEYPVIRLNGRDVEVTQDTADDLVGRGLATLVSGSLSPPKREVLSTPEEIEAFTGVDQEPDPEPEKQPEPEPEPESKLRVRRSRRKKG